MLPQYYLEKKKKPQDVVKWAPIQFSDFLEQTSESNINIVLTASLPTLPPAILRQQAVYWHPSAW